MNSAGLSTQDIHLCLPLINRAAVHISPPPPSWQKHVWASMKSTQLSKLQTGALLLKLFWKQITGNRSQREPFITAVLFLGSQNIPSAENSLIKQTLQKSTIWMETWACHSCSNELPQATTHKETSKDPLKPHLWGQMVALQYFLRRLNYALNAASLLGSKQFTAEAQVPSVAYPLKANTADCVPILGETPEPKNSWLGHSSLTYAGATPLCSTIPCGHHKCGCITAKW